MAPDRNVQISCEDGWVVELRRLARRNTEIYEDLFGVPCQTLYNIIHKIYHQMISNVSKMRRGSLVQNVQVRFKVDKCAVECHGGSLASPRRCLRTRFRPGSSWRRVSDRSHWMQTLPKFLQKIMRNLTKDQTHIRRWSHRMFFFAILSQIR